MPGWFTREHEPCKHSCYVCDKSYEKYILPIIYEGAKEFLGSSHFAAYLRETKLSYDEPDELCESLWGSEDWRKKVFGKKAVAKYNVFSFFFQLAALRLIDFVTVRKTSDVLCVLSRDEKDKLKYKKKRIGRGSILEAHVMGGHGFPLTSYKLVN